MKSTKVKENGGGILLMFWEVNCIIVKSFNPATVLSRYYHLVEYDTTLAESIPVSDKYISRKRDAKRVIAWKCQLQKVGISLKFACLFLRYLALTCTFHRAEPNKRRGQRPNSEQLMEEILQKQLRYHEIRWTNPRYVHKYQLIFAKEKPKQWNWQSCSFSE